MFHKHRMARFIGLLLVVCSRTAPAQEALPAGPASRQGPPTTPDAKEIVRRALDVDQANFQLARNYTFERREEIKLLGKKGNLKKHEINTYDMIFLYDEPWSRHIRKDDKPLASKEDRKEAEKMDRFIAERKNESEEKRQKRLEKREKERQEERAFVRDVINAYDFRIVGEEQVDGYGAYAVDATPRADFHPTQPHAEILSKLRGEIWISKKDYGCVKLQAEILDTITWRVLLVRIHKGTEFELEQTHVNDEIWLPHRMSLHASARIALFVNDVVDWESTFSDYKKFTTGVRILPGVVEVSAPADSPPSH